MVSEVDVKWQINDELRPMLSRVRELEVFVRQHVHNKKEQKKLMQVLLEVEDGVERARRLLGE